MDVPDYQTLMLPVLRHAGLGAEVVIRELIARLANEFGLSDEDRHELFSGDTETRFNNSVYWAKTYLQRAGLVESTGPGRFRITPRGSEALARNPARIDNTFLSQVPEFLNDHCEADKVRAIVYHIRTRLPWTTPGYLEDQWGKVQHKFLTYCGADPTDHDVGWQVDARKQRPYVPCDACLDARAREADGA